MSVRELKDSEFDHAFKLIPKDLQGHVVVLFYRPTCPHCVMFKPNFYEAAKKGSKGVVFGALNTDAYPGTLDRLSKSGAPYDVEGVPTVVSYSKGKYFSTYGPTDENFRTTPDVLKFAETIDHADVTYKH